MEIGAYLWLIVWWSLYFFTHSLLASQIVKDTLLNKGLSLKFQRLAYNFIAIIGLLGLLFYNGYISSEVIFARHQGLKIMALFLGGAGVLIMNAAFRQFNTKSFLGFENEEETLNKSGILGYIRHPLYAGTILLTAGFFVYDPRWPTLVSLLCIYAYLPIGIYLEEKKLVKKFGQLYIDYKKEVPAIIPTFNLF